MSTSGNRGLQCAYCWAKLSWIVSRRMSSIKLITCCISNLGRKFMICVSAKAVFAWHRHNYRKWGVKFCFTADASTGHNTWGLVCRLILREWISICFDFLDCCKRLSCIGVNGGTTKLEKSETSKFKEARIRTTPNHVTAGTKVSRPNQIPPRLDSVS